MSNKKKTIPKERNNKIKIKKIKVMYIYIYVYNTVDFKL